MSERKELIDVRPDERFDEKNLTAYLADKREALDVGEQPFTVRQFGGGMANLTYLLDFGDKELVLRRPPLGPVAASAHDMGREYAVLSRLYKVFPYAPRAYVYCEDPAVIGAPFFIMERRHGLVIRGRLPEQFDNDQAPPAISRAMVDALADFHQIDYEAIGLGDLGKPQGFIGRQIEGWYKRWHKAKHTDVPEMDTMYEWLTENKPTSEIFSLIHNDYKLDNVMMDSEDPGKMIAIFDWDMCTLGNPMSDLGSLLAYWTDPDDAPYMQMLSATFMPTGKNFYTRAQLVERYAERTGFNVDNISYYHALALYRLVVILAQIYIRYVRGQTQDKRFAGLGEMVPLLAKAAQDVALGK